MKGSTLKAQLTLTLLLCLSLFFAACSPAPEEDSANRDAREVMENDDRLGTFGTAMTTAGMDSEFGETPLTVFAPTLDAFEVYAEAKGLSLGELLASPQLGLVLQYHIAEGSFRAEDLSNFDEVATLSGESIAVEVTEEGVLLNGSARVIEADIRARNTIIHIIDKVLEPPTPEPEPDIVDIASGDERFSILVAALQKAELVDALKADGPFTVFAPTNKAFEKLLKDLGVSAEELLASPELKTILLYHVLGARVSAAEAAQVNSATTLEGRDISIEARGNNLFINGDSKVIQADINASNGVIHAVNRVLLPPEALGTIPDVAAADGRFSTLVAALEAADLVDALSAEGPFTVFAPTDDAFAALLQQLGVTPAELLANPALATILKYHVVPGKVMAADIVKVSSVTTLEGREVSVEVNGGGVVLNGDVNVVQTDVAASNGVIHVIDGVLLPPEDLGTIPETAAADERFTTLVAALEAANLVDALSGDGPFTVFAPTDDAFKALLEQLGVTAAELLANPALETILKYHVVPGNITAADIVKLNSVTTLAEQDISVEVLDSGVVLNGSVNIIETDIKASNGVIHVIDGVLLPSEPLPSIVDIVVGDERFSLLEAALGKAGLVEALGAEGPFTVFAPTDDAFIALAHALHVKPADLLELPQLKDILLYHVASGKVSAEQAASLDSVTTLQGAEIKISTDGHGGLILNGKVKVIEANIEASNGIIHVIDAVLLPPEH